MRSICLVVVLLCVTFAARAEYDPKPDLTKIASIADKITIHQPYADAPEMGMDRDRAVGAVQDSELILRFWSHLVFRPECIRGDRDPDGLTVLERNPDQDEAFEFIFHCGDAEILSVRVLPDGSIYAPGIRHGTTLHLTEASKRDVLSFIESAKDEMTKGEPGATDNPDDAQRLREDH